MVGRDNYGVFPLKGKLLNVRDATTDQVKKNNEIQNIVKIMVCCLGGGGLLRSSSDMESATNLLQQGLQFGKVYEDTKSLRYGRLMIMTDQDQDGSHIKGLIINFIHHFWPSLLKVGVCVCVLKRTHTKPRKEL